MRGTRRRRSSAPCGRCRAARSGTIPAARPRNDRPTPRRSPSPHRLRSSEALSASKRISCSKPISSACRSGASCPRRPTHPSCARRHTRRRSGSAKWNGLTLAGIDRRRRGHRSEEQVLAEEELGLVRPAPAGSRRRAPCRAAAAVPRGGSRTRAYRATAEAGSETGCTRRRSRRRARRTATVRGSGFEARSAGASLGSAAPHCNQRTYCSADGKPQWPPRSCPVYARSW